MKVKSILSHATFLLLLAIIFASCDKKTTHEVDKPADKEKFCSHVNAANIDQTIPIVNQFLSGLSAELNDERQLQELTTWLKSCPCIIDAEILPTSEILISFVENGTTKRFVIAVTMEKPLKIAGYSEYEEPAADEFCTFLNAANIEKTIPFVDEFLSGLPAELDGEQQLQALAAWLQSQPCIAGADVLCNQCYISNPLKSEILISFDENGTTKRFSMFFSMAQPSKVEGYHEYEEPAEFCSYLNVNNIDKTIPFVNEFLSGLSTDLDIEEQLQALVVWLQSQPCIIDATIKCKSCIEISPPMSEITISFDENGTTKCVIMSVQTLYLRLIVIRYQFCNAVDIPFTEYPLYATLIVGTSCRIRFISSVDPADIRIIRCQEEFEEFTQCTDENVPDLDFSNNSYICVMGGASQSPSSIQRIQFQQISKKTYFLYFDVRIGFFHSTSSWYAFIRISKLPKDVNIILDVNSYKYY